MPNSSLLKSWNKVFESDLDKIVLEIKECLKLPAVIFLEGPLGSGKTTFTQHFFKLNGESTLSPTYSLVNEVGPFVHADFYRLKDPQEIIHLELEYYLENKDFFIVEWGKPYLNTLIKYFDKSFSIYQLNIEIQKDHRNFTLLKLDLMAD